jgi:hypothetical protein
METLETKQGIITCIELRRLDLLARYSLYQLGLAAMGDAERAQASAISQAEDIRYNTDDE